MNLLCDALIVAIIILAAIIGRRKGFVRTFFGFFGSIIAFAFSAIFSKSVGAWLSEKFISPSLTHYVMNAVSEKISDTASEIDFSSVPSGVLEVFQKFGHSAEEIQNFANGISAEAGESVSEKVAGFVVAPISSSVSYAIAFILLFVIGIVAIRIIASVFNLIAKLPGLNFSNKALGLACGVLWGLFISFILAQLLVIASPALQSSENVFLNSFSLDKTYIVKTLSRFNPISFFIKL